MQTNVETAGKSIPPRPARPPSVGPAPAVTAGNSRHSQVTRAGVIWAATLATLMLLILMIVLILQNQAQVELQYLGLAGSLPLGLSLFIAAVSGGALVAIAGAVRIAQLRRIANRGRPATPPPAAGT